MRFYVMPLLVHIGLVSLDTGLVVLEVKHLLRPLQCQRAQLCTFHVGGTRPILPFFHAHRTAVYPQLGLLLCLSSLPACHAPLATRSAPCPPWSRSHQLGRRLRRVCGRMDHVLRERGKGEISRECRLVVVRVQV
jgi:hypothetical protein